MKTLATLALAMMLSVGAHAASVTTWGITPDAGETISDPVLRDGVLFFKITTGSGTGGSITFKMAPTEGGGGDIIAANLIMPPAGTMAVGADTWAFGKAVGDGRYVILRNKADTNGKGELVKAVKSDIYTRYGKEWYKWFGGTSWGWIGSTEP